MPGGTWVSFGEIYARVSGGVQWAGGNRDPASQRWGKQKCKQYFQPQGVHLGKPLLCFPRQQGPPEFQEIVRIGTEEEEEEEGALGYAHTPSRPLSHMAARQQGEKKEREKIVVKTKNF